MINKLDRKKGFTLAELLVVVAIIAVLVAVAIPVFSSQLEKSREATDLANVRSAYAKMKVAILSDEIGDSGVEEIENGYQISIPLKQKKSDWQTSGTLNIGGIEKGDENWQGVPEENGTCTITYNTADESTIIHWGDGTSSSNGGVNQSVFICDENVVSGIYGSFASLSRGDYDSFAPDKRKDDTTTGTSLARKELVETYKINMSAMGAETWRASKLDNGLDLYVTPINVNNVEQGTYVPVMKLQIDNNGKIKGYSVGTKRVDTNSSLSNEPFNYLNQDSNYKTYSTYNDAVDKINELLQDNTNFKDYSMNKIPED